MKEEEIKFNKKYPEKLALENAAIKMKLNTIAKKAIIILKEGLSLRYFNKLLTKMTVIIKSTLNNGKILLFNASFAMPKNKA